jgi:hypothetical protein
LDRTLVGDHRLAAKPVVDIRRQRVRDQHVARRALLGLPEVARNVVGVLASINPAASFSSDLVGRPSASATMRLIRLPASVVVTAYDQVPAGCEASKRHLTTEAISGGGEPGITTTYCYAPAQFGRLASESSTTGGTTYQTSYTYDVLGRVSQVR